MRSWMPPERSSTAATWRCRAIENGKHLVLMNAEVDGTVGPLLGLRAKAAGRGAHGLRRRSARRADEPGPLRPRHRPPSAGRGNIKGLQDEYRTPTTQRGFAEKWGQDPYMVTSFADGTKVSFEQALVANATGMTVAKRGMRGMDHRGHVDELTGTYDVAELEQLGGVVDYVVGSTAGARGLRAGHPRRSEAAALPQPVQARRGAAVQLLHAVPPVPLRGAADRGPRGAVR